MFLGGGGTGSKARREVNLVDSTQAARGEPTILKSAGEPGARGIGATGGCETLGSWPWRSKWRGSNHFDDAVCRSRVLADPSLQAAITDGFSLAYLN
jgi:hypothetical protein